MSDRIRRICAWITSLLLLLTVSACQPDPTSTASATATPDATAAPILPSAATLPSVVTPVLTTAPVPTPTATPFSYYAPTVTMSFEELVGDIGYDTLPEGFPTADTYHVIVDICHQVVLVYMHNADGTYTVPVRYMLCSTGIDNRTPVGTFDMMAYHVRFGLLSSLGMYTQYWSQIRNRIYFHSILYTEKDAPTYVEDTYGMLGQPNTPGCVYLTVPDARWIYYHIAPGTQIEIREGSADDAGTAAIRAQLVLAPLPETRLTLDIDSVPYTDNWFIEDVPAEVPFAQGNQN